jgi:tetratricopeptide (TPR) repeat protein
MMPAETDWVSAVAFLASGLILGLMLIFYLSRRKSVATAAVELPDVELQDLEARRDLLIAQLREIDAAGPGATPEQQAERRRLELAAAEVLREIDDHQGVVVRRRATASAAAQEVAAPAALLNPTSAAIKGFVWGVVSVGVLVGLGFFVYRSANPRGEGDGATGTPMAPNAMAQQPAQNDPTIMAMEASLAQTPDDVNKRVELARAYLERDELMKVFEHTGIVLKDHPEEPRALTYNALVRMAMGQPDEATDMLKKANRIAPNFIDASVALAWVYTQTQKPKEAEATMMAAMEQHPEEKARLQEVLSDMKNHKAEVQKAAGPVDPNAPLPPGHPSIEGAPAAAAMAAGAPAAPADGKAVKVTLNLDPSAKGRAAGSVLYVIARAAGVMAGPPAAVKRINGATFPLTFDLGAADSMMGQALPGVLRIEARLDADGDAKTKGPNDFVAAQDGVAAGASITLNLR